MKPSKEFQKTIKNYLDKRAAEDTLFAETLKKVNKNIEECCNYVMKCAKDGGCAGYSDDEVFRWAVHYYDEDDIKNIAPVGGKVVINQSIELTEDDKIQAKSKAMEIAINEAKVLAKKELSETIELNADDLADAKKLALEKVVNSEREKLLTKSVKRKVEVPTEEAIDLFS